MECVAYYFVIIIRAYYSYYTLGRGERNLLHFQLSVARNQEKRKQKEQKFSSLLGTYNLPSACSTRLGSAQNVYEEYGKHAIYDL